MIGKDRHNKKLRPVKRKKGGQAKRLSPRRSGQTGPGKRQYLTAIQAVIGHPWLPKGIIVLLLALAVIWGRQQIQLMNYLPIEKVQIYGQLQHLSEKQLVQQAMEQVQGGFFSVDLQQVKDALQQQPWVESIAVRRVWPDTLGVQVIEKQAVAYWNKDQLLSAKAVLFKPQQLPQQLPLPRLNGPQGQYRNMFVELSRMQAWLAPTGLQIAQLRQDARRSWTLKTQQGIEVRLGRQQHDLRLQRFAEVFSRRLQKQKQQIRHIDMRYSNGFAIAWKEA